VYRARRTSPATSPAKHSIAVTITHTFVGHSLLFRMFPQSGSWLR
jgi:hypothetical protein